MKRRRIDVNLGELDQLPRGSDGANPVGGLIGDSADNLYGTTQDGGASGIGLVFEITP
jgi:hypothetical protein